MTSTVEESKEKRDVLKRSLEQVEKETDILNPEHMEMVADSMKELLDLTMTLDMEDFSGIKAKLQAIKELSQEIEKVKASAAGAAGTSD